MSKYPDLDTLTAKFPTLTIESYGGALPLQAEGLYRDLPYYFRLRHSWASLSLGGEDVVGAPLYYEELLIAPEGEDIGFAESKDYINIFSKLLNTLITRHKI